ncbi:MAG: DMT family transporter [Acidobacteriaceae bacterium]
MSRKLSASTLAHVLMLAVVFVWGSTFVLVKDALRDASPLLFNLLRMTLAFVVLAIVYRKHWKKLTPRVWASGAIVGLCLAMGYQFQTAGLALTTPSKSAFITGLVVVLVPLLSAIPGLRPAGAHAPAWNAWMGAILAFGGIILLTTPEHTAWAHLFSTINFGDVLSLGCALGFALHVIALAHTSPRIGFAPLAMLQIGFCAIFMAITMPIFEHPHLVLSPRLAIALLIAAVLATALAFSVQSYAQQHLPATHTALLLALEPVFAWLTSYIVLQERLGMRGSVGAILILGGILMTELLQPAHSTQSPIHTAHELG